jgi:hypothetical protein
MITVMCLRFVFLLITRLTSWLRPSRREEAWKVAEILILRHQLAVLQRRQPRRPDLDWADRVLLATMLAVIPKARRQALRLLVTPDTALRWHGDIVCRRWAARSKRGGTARPATRRTIKALVFRLARENPGWGYRRILGELASLGVKIAASTVWEILNNAGMDPAPRRTAPTWPQFLRSEELGIYRLPLQVGDLYLLRQFAEDVLGPLLDYDAWHKVDLVGTLSVYLNQYESLKQTARVLRVHVNTVGYRIQRIEHLTSLDLTNPDHRLSAHVAAKIVESQPPGERLCVGRHDTTVDAGQEAACSRA